MARIQGRDDGNGDDRDDGRARDQGIASSTNNQAAVRSFPPEDALVNGMH